MNHKNGVRKLGRGLRIMVAEVAVILSIAFATHNFAGASDALAYSGDAAAQYADLYALSPNCGWPFYGNPPDNGNCSVTGSQNGGDCTNYVSQALNAGGMSQVTGVPVNTYNNDNYWYMYFAPPSEYPPNGSWLNTYSWTAAGDLWQFLYNSGRAAQYDTWSGAAYTANHSGVYTGDLLAYSFYQVNGPIDHWAMQV